MKLGTWLICWQCGKRIIGPAAKPVGDDATPLHRRCRKERDNRDRAAAEIAGLLGLSTASVYRVLEKRDELRKRLRSDSEVGQS